MVVIMVGGWLGFFMVVHHVGCYHGGRIVRGFMLMRDGGGCSSLNTVRGILMVIPISSFIPISSCLVSS